MEVNMIGWRIKAADSEFALTMYKEDDIYNEIVRISGDEELAIEVCGWADVAIVGTEFEDDKFIVEVVENNLTRIPKCFNMI